MDLNIKSLQDAGAFAGAPVQREVEWEQSGEKLKATTYIRKMSYRMAASDIKELGGAGEMVASRIAACVCDEKGQAVFTVADITGDASADRGPLNYNLTMALLTAISEVNSPGKPTA